MTTPTTCPACGETRIEERTYEQDLEFKGAELHVTKLLQFVCQSCDYAFESHVQHDANIDRIRAAFVATRAAYKAANNLLTGETIRRARKMLGLTQQEAAKLFGGGVNAFSKYENEEIVQSASMDTLIRLVALLGKSGLEALRSAKTYEPASEGPAEIAVVDASAHEVVIAGNTNLLREVHSRHRKMRTAAANFINLSLDAWSKHEMLRVFTAGGASEARVIGAMQTSDLAIRRAPTVEIAAYGTNPVTGAMYKLVRPKAKKELANESGK